VVLVACQRSHDQVQVWTDEMDAENAVIRSARVYGTGQPLPPRDAHVGSAIPSPDSGLVWHVLRSERPANPPTGVAR
jgi:hypothetical protein